MKKLIVSTLTAAALVIPAGLSAGTAFAEEAATPVATAEATTDTAAPAAEAPAKEETAKEEASDSSAADEEAEEEDGFMAGIMKLKNVLVIISAIFSLLEVFQKLGSYFGIVIPGL